MKQLNELKLKDKKYIIFDMDGTLIDSIGVWNRTDQKLNLLLMLSQKIHPFLESPTCYYHNISLVQLFYEKTKI